MKFYIAGKWQDRHTIKWLVSKLLEKGHSISCDWTNHNFDKNGVIATKSKLLQIVQEDIDGVANCDTYVGVLVKDYNYKGLWVEMGIAIALGKNIFTIGEAGDSCIFMNHPHIRRFRTIEEFLESVSKEEILL